MPTLSNKANFLPFISIGSSQIEEAISAAVANVIEQESMWFDVVMSHHLPPQIFRWAHMSKCPYAMRKAGEYLRRFDYHLKVFPNKKCIYRGNELLATLKAPKSI